MVNTRSLSQSLVLVVVAVALFATVGPAARPAAAAEICSRWAASTGNDSNDGSQARPVATIRTLAKLLNPGETGCLKNGTTISTAGGWGVFTQGGAKDAPITIRSEPGGRATVLGQIHIPLTVTDVTLRDLDIVGPSTLSQGSTLVIVDGHRTSLLENDITHPRGVCVDVGHVDGWEGADATPPTVDFVLDGNRVHDCGMDPNNVFSQADSGAHGVYMVHTRNARITNNLVYRNRWRGLQTWPKADGTLIANNVFDQNATHVNIGSSLTEGGPWYSSNTIVRDNVMTNRVTDYRPEKNPANIYGNFPAKPETYGNQAFGNCIDTGGGDATGGNGIAFGANTTGDAVYVDRAAGDFRLAPGSPCAGKGPQDLQAPAALAVTVRGPGSASTGAVVKHQVTVHNPSGTAVSGASVGVTRTGAATVATSSFSGAACGGGSCSVPDLAPDARVTITVTYAVAGAGALTTSAVLDGSRAATTTSVSGAACTVAGGLGRDVLNGTAHDDVLCGFTGADVLRPGAGDDVVLGGGGRDVVSYSDAAGGVIVNLGQKSAWDEGNAAVGWDTFTSVESAEGSSFADTLVGSGGANVLRSRGGADRLLGYGGNDRLLGGGGNDRLDGGANTDTCRQHTGTGTMTACEL